VPSLPVPAFAATPRRHGNLTLTGFIAVSIVVSSIVAATYSISEQHDRAAGWVDHTHEVLTALAVVRSDVMGLQNALRGFVLTGRDRELQSFQARVDEVRRDVDRVRDLVSDNPAQLSRVAAFESELNDRIANTRSIVEARQAGGLDAALAAAGADVPEQQMTRLSNALDAFEVEERRLLGTRQAEARERLDWLWIAITTLVVVLGAMLAILYVQIQRRTRQQNALLESEQRFHLMTQSVVDYALIMLDPDGNVATWNPGAARILGYDESEILGKPAARFYPPEEVERGKPEIEREAATTAGRYEEEDWRVRKDGSRFWANVVVTPLRDGDGNLRGFVKITRDLSERKRVEESLRAEVAERRRVDEQLQRLNKSLEAAVEDRTAELRTANAQLFEAKRRAQDLSVRLIAAQEEERRRIAHELHDETGQALTAIKLRLFDALQNHDNSTRALEECVEIVDQTVKQIRNMAVSLRPMVLDDLGLAEALEWALDRQAKATGWRATLRMDPLPDRLPPEIETACFRVGQEALTNVARHAAARSVEVSLRLGEGVLTLSIRDDGNGFDYQALQSTDAREKHFGLLAMSERVNLVGGAFDVNSAPGNGTEIRVTFPLERAVH